MTRSVTVWSPTTGDVVLTAALLAQILGEDGGGLSDTPITTAGDGVLTAVGLTSGQIARTGPTAAFTDTTATAAAIVALLGANITVGETFITRIKNGTAFAQTLAAGTGVTLPVSVVVPALSAGWYYGTVGGTQAVPTVVLTHMFTTLLTSQGPLAATALVTVGAGTITAAGIAGGVTTRSGSQSFTGFTDTTATAALIRAAQPNVHIGLSWEYKYVNNTNAPATIAGSTGVTVSGITVVPANSTATYLATYTTTDTITLVGLDLSMRVARGTYLNNGATAVTVADTAVTADSQITFTLKTVGGTVSASAPNVKTITPGTGFTVAGLASDTSTYNYEIRG